MGSFSAVSWDGKRGRCEMRVGDYQNRKRVAARKDAPCEGRDHREVASPELEVPTHPLPTNPEHQFHGRTE